ncbi:hypothetical protein PSQ19_01810 [Devosia algicola]|uniref:NADH-quinone oxidoreductase subunit E n=1 Tax=Devosia algicola TaxID=3026418 RepID=A0ABY7YPL6_9HYPH|nr:hypothetical protein [Devosia algicola]WDR02979.1 hypothetical protein PSQ19_01810 [Devosia algicola]
MPASVATDPTPEASKTSAPSPADPLKAEKKKTARKLKAAQAKPRRAAKPMDPKPASLKAPRAAGKDDLKKIKGIGPKIESTLNDLGVFHFDQIGKWTKANAEWMDTHLSFKGRVAREDWISQAKKLAKTK